MEGTLAFLKVPTGLHLILIPLLFVKFLPVLAIKSREADHVTLQIVNLCILRATF